MNSRNHETCNPKAKRLGEDWESFMSEHPELIVEKKDGKIVNIIFPPEAECRTLVLLENFPNNVYSLHYIYEGVSIDYEAPEARNSLLYELMYNHSN